jgi:hypothetical protein
VLGLAAGLVVFSILLVGLIYTVPSVVSGTAGSPPLLVRAVILAVQLSPLVLALPFGTSLVRRGRLRLGWFLIATGVFAAAPAAACDLAGLLQYEHGP